MLKPALLLFFLALTFGVEAQNKGFSPKLAIDKKLQTEFEKEKDKAKVYDAFKDCSCSVDTVNKSILIKAGYDSDSGEDYLNFDIKANLSVAVEHRYWGDLIPFHADPANPFPPFVIKRFAITADRDPFTDPMKGFLLKYRFKKNRSPSQDEIRSELSGYINCHAVTYSAPRPRFPTANDSLQLLKVFLKDTVYINLLKEAGYAPATSLAGNGKPWPANIPGYHVITAAQAKAGKDPAVVISTHANYEIIGGYVMLWRYYVNGVEKRSGMVTYVKFGTAWLAVKHLY